MEHCFSACGSQLKLLWFTIMCIITQSKISVFYNYKLFFCFTLVCTWPILNTIALIPILGVFESFVAFFRNKQPKSL